MASLQYCSDAIFMELTSSHAGMSISGRPDSVCGQQTGRARTHRKFVTDELFYLGDDVELQRLPASDAAHTERPLGVVAEGHVLESAGTAGSSTFPIVNTARALGAWAMSMPVVCTWS